MARSFNLTAEINLRAPGNLKSVVSEIRRELGTVSANVNLKLDAKSAKSISAVKSRLDAVNNVLVSARGNTDALNASLQTLTSSLSAAGSAGARGAGSIKATASAAKSASESIKIASSGMEEFGKQAFLAVKRFAAFSFATSGIIALTGAITSGFKAFIEYDKELIRLQQTTGKSAAELKVLEKTITDLSINLGVSSESLAQVAVTLAQAGLSANETRIALAALAKTELAPSFDSLAETTEGAIAAMRQFDISAGDLEAALGSINAVAAAFAVEADDLIGAIQRTGGVFAAASKGVSEGKDALNEFLAVFTSVRQTTRESAETIATGLRTIFTRIQRAKTIDQLREFGIELTDLEGKFVGPYEAVRRLSEGLKQLDPRDIRFSSIVEELGGFRQIGKVIPLIQQFAVAQEALKVAQKGQGSLTDAQAIAQKSLANQIAKVREQFLAFIRDVGKSEVFQSLFKIVVGLTSGLISLASAFKPILPVLAIMGAIKGVKAIGDFGAGFFGAMGKGGARGTGENLGSSISGSKEKEKADATNRASEVIKANTSAISDLTSAVQALTNKIGSGGSPTTLNSGGKVLAFARGGIVPGSGNRDTVPAMLQPGEFVIRKKAVETIGSGNLHKMNKYASGGPVEEYSASRPLVKNIDSTFDKPADVPISTAIKNTPRLVLNKKDTLGVDIERRGFSGSELAKQQPNSRISQDYLNSKDPRSRGLKFEDLLLQSGKIATKGGGGSRIDAITADGSFVEIKSTQSTSDQELFEKAAGAIFSPVTDSVDKVAMKKASQQALSSKPDRIGFGTLYEFFDSDVRKMFSGGFVQKFAFGGKALGARSKFKELTQEEILQLSTPDLIAYGRALAQDIFTTRGAGMAVGNEFIEVPEDRIVPELESSLITHMGKRGFWREKVAPFGKAIAQPKPNVKMDRKDALASQVTKYADEVAAREQNWTAIKSGSDIDNYLLSKLQDPILSDYKTVRGGGSLLKQFHNTRLRKAVNEALENYDDFDYSPSNIDKLVSGMAAERFAYGGLIQKFEKGTTGYQGVQPISSDPIAAQSILDKLQDAGGSRRARELLTLKTIEQEISSVKTSGKRPQPSGVFDKTFLKSPDAVPFLSTLSSLADRAVELFEGTSAADFNLTPEQIAAARDVAIAGFQSDMKDLKSYYRLRKGVPLRVHTGIITPDKYPIIDELLEEQHMAQVRAAQKFAPGENITPIKKEDRQKFGESNLGGYNLEAILALLGSGDGKKTTQDAIDFASGLTPLAAGVFGVPPNIPTQAKLTVSSSNVTKALDGIIKTFAFGGKAEGPGFEEVRKQIMDKYPDIDFRISKRKKGRGFGYNLLGALKSDGGLLQSKGLKFEQPSNLQKLIESSDKMANNLLNPQTFALGGLAEATGEMQGLMMGLYGNRQKDEQQQTKPQKNFGKIALRKDANSIAATYFRNDTRNGQVSAYKMRDYLYYVGLSQATKGYGPRLYDAVMEAATEEGAMLTSDRNSVSGAAKKVWEYYFNNRGDVKKTPLKPDDWSRNQADIDPKLYGKPETWPPASDPAWILQSGYSKSPSLINDPGSVIRMDKQAQSGQVTALQYFQSKSVGFANGGSAEDTVPALLTPGEFVINKKAAQKIGYARLNKLNKADKIQGYNKGGYVGIKRFFRGGVAEKDAVRAQGAALTDIKQAEKAFAMIMGQVGKDIRDKILSGFKGIESVKAGSQEKLIRSGSSFSENTRGRANMKKDATSMGLQIQGKKVSATAETVAHEAGHLADYSLGSKKGFASETKGTFQFDLVEKVKPQMEAAFKAAGMDAVKIEKYLASNVELFAEFFAKASPQVRAIITSTTDAKEGMAKLAQHLGDAGYTYAGLEASDIDTSVSSSNKPSQKPSLGSRLFGGAGSALGSAASKIGSLFKSNKPSAPVPPSGPSAPTAPIPPSGGGGPSPDEKQYFEIKAKQAGQSIEQFSKTLIYAAKDLAKDLQDSLKTAKVDFKTGAIELVQKFKASDPKTKEGSQIRKDVIETLASKIKGIDPSKSESAAKTLAMVLASKMSGGESFDKIVDSNVELKNIMDRKLTDQQAQLEALKKVSEEKGLSPEVIENVLGDRLKEGKDNGLTRFIDYLGGPLKVTTRSMLLAASALEAGANYLFELDKKNQALLAGAIGGIKGGAQGAAVVAEMDIGKNVNEFGKFLQGFGGRLGSVGQSLQKFSGGIQAAAIAYAAVSGAIKGFANAFNQAKLEQALEKLTIASDKTSEAFKRLEKSPTNANATLAQMSMSQEMDAMEGLRRTGAVDIKGKRTLETARAFDFTGITGAVSGQEQEKEARKAYFDVSARRFEQFGTLGARRLNEVNPKEIQDAVATANKDDSVILRLAKELEDLQAAPTKDEAAIKGKQAEVDAAQQAKAEKLYKKSQRFGQIASMEGEQEALRQFYLSQAQTEEEKNQRLKALNGQMGNTDEERAQNQQRAIDAAKRLAAAEAEGEIRTKLLSDATQKLNLQTENLLRTYSVATALLQRFSESINLIADSANNTANAIEGRAQIGKVDRTNENILGNIEAYSLEEVRSAAVQTGALAGGGIGGDTLQNQVLTAKVLQEALPQALATTGSKDVDEVINKLEDSFGQAGIAFSEPIKEDLKNALQAEANKDQGVSFQKLAQESDIVANLLKQTEAGLKAAQEFQKRYNDALSTAIELQNNYAQALTQSIDYQIKASEIRSNASVQLKETLGQRVTSDDRNAAFDTRIRALTSTNVIPGGTTDPDQVFQQLMSGVAGQKSQEDELNRRKQALAAAPTEDNKARVAEQMQAMAKQNVAINNSRKALEELANDGTKAANALKDLQELDRVSTGATNFTRNVFTASGDELNKINKQLLSFTKFRTGRATDKELNNLEFRQNVFGGGDLIKSVLPKEIADQLDAQLSLDMLKRTPGSAQALGTVVGKGPDGEDITLESALKMKAGGKDPVQEKYIKAYEQAVNVQARAAENLGKAAQAVADTFNNKMLDVLTQIQQQLPTILEQSVTAGMTPAVAAAYKEMNNANKERQALDTTQAANMGLDTTGFNAVSTAYDAVQRSKQRTEDLVLSQAKAQGFESVEEFKTTAPDKYQRVIESDQYKASINAQKEAESNFGKIATNAGLNPEAAAEEMVRYRASEPYVAATAKIKEKEEAFRAAQAGPQSEKPAGTLPLEQKPADTKAKEEERQKQQEADDLKSLYASFGTHVLSFAAAVTAFGISVALMNRGGGGGGGGGFLRNLFGGARGTPAPGTSGVPRPMGSPGSLPDMGSPATSVPRPMGAPGSLPGMGSAAAGAPKPPVGGAGGGFGLPSWVGLSQIAAPFSGGSGVFGATASTATGGAALGTATAAGALYGGYAVIDTINSVGELFSDWNGKLSELDARAKQQLDQGYLASVTQNLMQPGDTFLDFVGGLGELAKNYGTQALEATGVIESQLQAIQEKAKTKKAVYDEKTGQISYVERDKNDALKGLSLDEQNSARQEAATIVQLNKAKELKASGGSVADYAKSIGANESDFQNQTLDSIIANREEELKNLETGRVKRRTEGNWLPNSMTGAGQDTSEYDAAVQQEIADRTATVARMAEEATKPGSIYTHDIHLEKLLGQLIPSMGEKGDSENSSKLMSTITGAASGALKKISDPANIADTGKKLIGGAIEAPEKLASKGSDLIKTLLDPKGLSDSLVKSVSNFSLSDLITGKQTKSLDDTELKKEGAAPFDISSLTKFIPQSILDKLGIKTQGATPAAEQESCECKLLAQILAAIKDCCVVGKTATPTTQAAAADANSPTQTTPTSLTPNPESALQESATAKAAENATQPRTTAAETPAVPTELVKLDDDRQKVIDASKATKQRQVDLLKKQVAAAKRNVAINKGNGATGEKSAAILAEKEALLASAEKDLGLINSQEANELEEVRKTKQAQASLAGKQIQYTTSNTPPTIAAPVPPGATTTPSPVIKASPTPAAPTTGLVPMPELALQQAEAARAAAQAAQPQTSAQQAPATQPETPSTPLTPYEAGKKARKEAYEAEKKARRDAYLQRTQPYKDKVAKEAQRSRQNMQTAKEIKDAAMVARNQEAMAQSQAQWGPGPDLSNAPGLDGVFGPEETTPNFEVSDDVVNRIVGSNYNSQNTADSRTQAMIEAYSHPTQSELQQQTNAINTNPGMISRMLGGSDPRDIPPQDPNNLRLTPQPVPTPLRNNPTPQYTASQTVAADQGASLAQQSTLSLDPASLKALTDMQGAFTAFGGYITQLTDLMKAVPKSIEITGGANYTMQVNITGAAAMEMLQNETKKLAERLVVDEIKQLKDKLNKIFPSEFKASGTEGKSSGKASE